MHGTLHVNRCEACEQYHYAELPHAALLPLHHYCMGGVGRMRVQQGFSHERCVNATNLDQNSPHSDTMHSRPGTRAFYLSFCTILDYILYFCNPHTNTILTVMHHPCTRLSVSGSARPAADACMNLIAAGSMAMPIALRVVTFRANEAVT